MKLKVFGSYGFIAPTNPHIWLHMAQQWRDVLAAQIVEHMYEDEVEDWFINKLVRENVNIAIAKQIHPIHGVSRPTQFPNFPNINNLGMIGFMLTTFLKTMCI
jgi:hypothetical protein